MITIRAYTVLGELHLTVTTTAGATRASNGLVIYPALHSGCYQIAEDTAPVDLVQAVCQMVDEVEHETGGRLYDHLDADVPSQTVSTW